MKQRFSSLDVKVIAHELASRLVPLRLSNVYDLSSRIFLFKFAKPDHREQLVLESGFRCHLTSFSRTTTGAPSAFVARLRKYLRSRRVTGIVQVGTDRIIELQFSDGQYRLFLEFYAAGNIILTDKDLKILAIFRNVSQGLDQEELRNGLTYTLTNKQNYAGLTPLSLERVLDGLQKADGGQVEGPATKSKPKRKTGDVLRKALAGAFPEFPPLLIDHALRLKRFDPATTPLQVIQDKLLQEGVLGVLQEAEKVLQYVTSSVTSTGYIIGKRKNGTAAGSDDASSFPPQGNEASKNIKYEDFHPFKPQQFIEDSTAVILSFDTFNHAVDEYFSSIEGQKLESRLHEKEQNAKKKLDSALTDHEKRLEGLQNMQQLNIRKAQAIEANLERVQEAIAATNGLIAQGMDWVEIARLIEVEQRRHNPVAEMIKLPLKLHENTVTLWLDEWKEADDYLGDETESEASDSEVGGDQEQQQRDQAGAQLSVDIDLALSPWANARQYYDQKRNAAEKEQKTLQQSSKAIKNMERKINADLKKGLQQEKDVLRPIRQQFWFEKFIFFVSSDGYLVLGGRDAQQDEILYKRHLKRGDVYVHANLDGAARVIVKNNPSTPEAPIPPSTLSQAGNLSIVTSTAWESKAIMSAWWVNHDQVSKTGHTGEYLKTGEFIIRGEKNFLAPTQLVLGFGVLFQISDESKARHKKNQLHGQNTESLLTNEPSLTLDMSEEQQHLAEGHDQEESEASDTSNEGEDMDSSDGELRPGAEEDRVSLSIERPNPLQPSAVEPSEMADLRSRAEDDDDEFVDSKDEGEILKSQMNSITLQSSIEEAHNTGASYQAAEDEEILRGEDMNMSAPQLPDNGGDGNPETVKEVDEATANKKTVQVDSKKPASQGRHVRGKHGKQKKLASKYANQDEEDRLIAMKLLGSATAKEKAEEEAQARSVQEERERQKQRRREQHERAAKTGKEQEEARRVADDDADALDDTSEHYSTAILDNLVGTPLPGDDILEAIPISAPWSVLHKYKYKVKLQPGTQKKGKAIKEILSRWIAPASHPANRRKLVDEHSEDTEKMWPHELDLIKAWREAEIMNSIPVGKMKVILPAGAAAAAAASGGRGSGKSGQSATAKAKGGGRAAKGSKKQR